MTESEIYFWAAQLDSEGRREFVEQACGENAELLEGVLALLPFAPKNNKRSQDGDSSEKRSPLTAKSSQESFEPESGVEIGDFRLLEQIGEGGMGTVWRAEQTHSLSREVAIKFIDAQFAAGSIVRFETERQAMTLMDHPNIAKIFHAGEVGAGQPYFVMEYVQGQQIKEYCKAQNLGLSDRLLLLAKICDAVQHAHQRGIIHRDLKPSNIMVSRIDGENVPKVIDFGLAKLMNPTPESRENETLAGLVMGTMQYMSPEQAVGGAVDTRTDIYALGVILHELLLGHPPIQASQIKSVSREEVVRQILQMGPFKPSQTLGDSTIDARKATAKRLALSESQLMSKFRKELDWIVIKALDKKPNERYATAGEFQRDIEAFMSNGSLIAHRPSSYVQFKKWCVNNKLASTSIAAFLAAVLVGLAGTSIGFLNASKNAKLENIAKIAAKEAAENEKKAKLEAIGGRNKLSSTLKIMQGFFEGFDPNLPTGGDGTLRTNMLERLKLAAQQIIDSELSGEDDIIVVKAGLANSLKSMGENQLALELWQNIVEDMKFTHGEYSLNHITAMPNLGHAYTNVGKVEKALAIYEEALAAAKIEFPENEQVLFALKHFVANAVLLNGRPKVALEEYKKLKAELANKGLASTALWCDTVHSLGTCQLKLERYEEARETFAEVLPVFVKVFGESHPLVMTAETNLLSAISGLGNKQDAIESLKKMLERRLRQFPEHSKPVHMTQLNLAVALAKAGETKEARNLLKLLIENGNQEIRIRARIEDAFVDILEGKEGVETIRKICTEVEDKFGKENGFSSMARESLKNAETLQNQTSNSD